MPALTSTGLLPFLSVIGVLLLVLLLRPRRFYLVRHGETYMNAKHIRQGEEGQLSEKGREQAERLGSYFSRLRISCMIASTYERTRETAAIINKHLNVPIMYSDLFVERRNPTEIIGRSTHDPDVVRIVDQMDLSYHTDDYRYSDEENFDDLKQRARKCVDLLAHQGEHNTVIVTHHVFLKMFLAYVLYRERLHAADFAKLAFFNFSDNATVTICEYRPWHFFSPTRGWRVLSYNTPPD